MKYNYIDARGYWDDDPRKAFDVKYPLVNGTENLTMMIIKFSIILTRMKP